MGDPMNPYTLEQLMAGALVVGWLGGMLTAFIIIGVQEFFAQKKVIPRDYDNQGA